MIAARPDLPDGSRSRVRSDPGQGSGGASADLRRARRRDRASVRRERLRAGTDRTIGHRAERPIGPDDATLAAPVPHGAPTPATHAMGHPAPTISSAATGHQVPASPTKRRAGAIAAAVLGALVVIAVGWLLFQNRRQPSGAEPPGDVAANEAPADAPNRPSRRAPNQRHHVHPRSVPRPTPNANRCRPRPVRRKASVSKPPVPPPAGVTAPNMPAPPLAAHGLAADAPAAATASDHPAAAGGEDHQAAARWAMPPAEAFAIFGLVADAWRQGRFELRALHRGRAAVRRRCDRRDLDVPASSSSGSWIAGGKALIAGDREAARSVVAEFRRSTASAGLGDAAAGAIPGRHPGPPPDWQVALFWADPGTRRARWSKRRLAAAPNDRNLQLARAVVDHLDGKHAEAARKAHRARAAGAAGTAAAGGGALRRRPAPVVGRHRDGDFVVQEAAHQRRTAPRSERCSAP